ncbi:L-carnitine dehydratase/bile acid-inducible protein F [Advenella kashmirensis WT001]|uniref:L-carnitine dehydratase/bile acid-inducible protein F n=1 Tax=Advenella kashmirensis (strain DSM 17095 / LMG 22695 / WT001) TaxID=1036672 RepID=I3UGG0_ADVKW|nr:CaiB/BaiF CoA-transferase family protein [Advenella kashmirensis]AFK64098.1 L-carnitine dehydratase/bile acid-inducible protein F [Advenella kashmirensis WT001]
MNENKIPSDKNEELPLAGIVVLDFSQFLAGPSCALRLADLGARVIKVERPDGGDACRSLIVANQTHDGDSALFHTINRNKQSYSADLKNPADLANIKKLLQIADVMIHNFRPGVMQRIGLDYDSVRSINPRLIYGEISGYGDEGPWRDKPGQDLLVQSLSGLAWLSGNANDGPVPAGLSIIDLMTGAHLAQGIMGALLKQARTGAGTRITVSLLESAMDLQFEPFTAFLNSDGRQPVRSTVNHANVHTAAPYGIYQTADGYLALAMTPLDKLGSLIGCATLAEQAKDPASWFDQRDYYKRILADHLSTQDTTHWLSILEPEGIWCAPVQNWPELIKHQGFKTLDVVQTITATSGASMKTTRCPIRIDGKILTCERPAPKLGADNAEIDTLLANSAT